MARRVNTTFLAVLAAVILGLMLSVLLAKKFLIHERPDKYIALGTEMMQKQKYDEAAKNFRHALALDPKNPDIWVQFGDALNQLSSVDVEYLRKARESWERALAIDPGNKLALNRLLSFWSELSDLDPRPEYFQQLGTTATALTKADPGNSAAQAAIYSATIRRWLGGVETDAAKIDEAVDKLTALMAKNPGNPDLPVFIAKAKLYQAERLRVRGGDDKPVTKLMAEADAIIQTSLKNQPNNAAIYFGAAQVAGQQQSAAQAVAANYQQQSDSSKPKDAKREAAWQAALDLSNKYLKQKRDLLEKARALVKPEDSLFVYIHVNAARAAAQQGDKTGAEKILRELLAKRPEDQQVRLALAEHIAGNGKRDEAIELLDRPMVLSNLTGPKSLVVRELEIRTMAAVTNMRLDAYTTAPKEQQEKLVGQIKDGISRVQLKDGDGVRSLMLRGKFDRLQGRLIDSIQNLERARQLAEKDGSAERQLDRWEIVDLLSRSYIETRQTGRAIERLNDLATQLPSYAPARILLTQLLIREGQIDTARLHIAELEKLQPNSPDVIKLKIQTIDPNDKEQIRKMYALFPETNKKEMTDKLNSAMTIGDKDDAVRLLKLLQAQNPDDVEVAKLGYRVYRTRQEYDKAAAVIADAKKKHPDDRSLDIFAAMPTTAPSAQAEAQLRRDLSKTESDPFRKEMLIAEACRIEGKFPEHVAHLQAAEKLKPGDPDAKFQLFNAYLSHRDFDKAAGYIEPLARMNQDQVNGLMIRFRYAMAKGDIGSGVELGRKLVSQMPDFGQSWLALAQALQASQQFDEALNKYLVALDRQSDNASAYKGAIECYYAMNRQQEARRKIDDAIKAVPAPGNQAFKDMAVNHELTYGKPALAIGPREEALKQNPDDPNAVLLAGRAYLAAGRADLKEGNTDTALARMAKARDLFNTGMTKWPDQPAFYAYFAEACAQRKELPDAEKALKAFAAREAWKDKPEPLMLLGEFYSRTSRPDEAIHCLQQALAKQPTNIDAELRLANVYGEQKKFDEAIKLLSTNGEEPRIIRRKVEMQIGGGKLEDADATLQSALAKSPESIELRALAGSVSLTRGRFEEAEQRLRQALSKDDKNGLANYYLGLVKMNQPQPEYDAAIAFFNKAKDSAGIGVDARFAMADCYRRGKNNADAAVRELEAALKANTGDKRVLVALLDAYAASKPPRWVDTERIIRETKASATYKPDPEVLKREAAMWQARGDMERAAAALGEAIALAPSDIELVRSYLALLVTTRNYAIAIQVCDKLIEQDRTRWWAYEARAIAKRYTDNREGALQDFAAALNAAFEKKNDEAAGEVAQTMAKEMGTREVLFRIKDRAEKEPRWALMVAYLLQQDRKIDEAVAQLDAVLARKDLSQSDKERAYRFGGSLYLQIKPKSNPQKAYECYQELLKLSPNDLTALNNMACLLAEVMNPPRPDEALTYSRKAYQIMQSTNMREPLIMDTHGWMLILAGNVDEGIAMLGQVVETMPVMEAHYHLAEGYLKKSFPEEARRQLDLADSMLKRAMSEHKPVDPTLRDKIDSATRRTQEMMRGRSQAAGQ